MRQHIKLVQCELLGLTATIEKHSEVIYKRMNPPIRNTPGDGRNRVEYVQDPVAHIEPVTLELNLNDNEAFMSAALRMFEQQLLDPESATPLKLYSRRANGTLVDEKDAIKAVMQEVQLPSGDTNGNALATGKIIVQPESLGSLA